MKIPSSEKEFIIDIRSIFPPLGLDYMYVVMGERREKIKQRLLEYDIINPDVPESKKNESIESSLGRIWRVNAQAILLARGLSMEDRSLLSDSSISKLSWVKEWHESHENSKDWNNGWFTRLPYQNRKFIMLVRTIDDYSMETPDIQLFRISHLPSDIKFEGCFPTIGELYIAHPYRIGIYLPVSKYEHLIFRERIHELSKVMMALGAIEIRTLHNSDSQKKSSSEESSNTSGSVAAGFWGNAKGRFSDSSNNLKESEKRDAIEISFKNDPIDTPKVPENLIWYPHDKEWQHIADCRIHGNILEYEISLSSKEINIVSDFERSNIEAQAKIFFASGSFSRETSSKTFFSEEAAKSTKILIKFKSRKDY